MCGIAGILSTSSITSSMASKLDAMQYHLTHRGPDAQGKFASPSKKALFAHTRLSIIDLSDDAAQPMSIGRYTITYNGEIYNYQILKQQLSDLGHRFISHSDTEVIVKLYQEYGVNCLNHLRGMFAFVIWDEETHCAFAARDPLGIKPFYYFNNDQLCAFSSEALTQMKKRRVDHY